MLPLRSLAFAFASIAAAQSAEPEFKMTTYQVAFLKRGPAWTAGVTEVTKKIQAGHMAHINAMAKTGKLILAGPFADGGELRGMFVFKCSAEEAKAMAEQDPAVKSGRLALEWHPWYSAEGIGIVNNNPPPPTSQQ